MFKVDFIKIKFLPDFYWNQIFLTKHRIVTKAFTKYLDKFTKIFLDDFMMYSDMESHLQKLKLCFQKCKEYGISPKSRYLCIYYSFRDDLGFYCFQGRENTKSKENTNNRKHAHLWIPNKIQVFNGMAQFYRCFIKNFVAIMAFITKPTTKT